MQLKNIKLLTQENQVENRKHYNKKNKGYSKFNSKAKYSRQTAFPSSTNNIDVFVFKDRKNLLPENEFNVLQNFIKETSKAGFIWTRDVLLSDINFIAHQNGRATYYNFQWLENFLTTKPSLTSMKEQTRRRIQLESKQQKNNWYNDLKAYLLKNNASDIPIFPNRIYFCGQIDVYAPPFSVLTTIGADGSVLPSLISYSDPSLIGRILSPVNKLKWFFSYSPSTKNIIEVFTQYVVLVLHPYLLSLDVQLPIIIFLDGRNFPISISLWQTCKQYGIILYSLPAEMIRNIRLQEDSIFRKVQENWLLTVNSYRQNNWYYLIQNFPWLFETCFNWLVNVDSVNNTFRYADIFPTNYFKNNSQQNNIKPQFLNNQLLTLDDYMSTKRVIEDFIGAKLTKKFNNLRNNKSNNHDRLFELWKLSADIVVSAQKKLNDENSNDLQEVSKNQQVKVENDIKPSLKRKQDSRCPTPCTKKKKSR